MKSLIKEEIKIKVQELAQQISRDYESKELLVIGVLKGACIFFSDLIRHIEIPIKTDFVIASSYVNK